MPDYVLGEPEPLLVDASPPLSEMFMLSPYAWTEGAKWRLALRAVPDAALPADKVSRVHLGTSDDGVHFTMEPEPFLAPDSSVTADDHDGCEDPTMVGSGDFTVFYSGWNQASEKGQLLWAAGQVPGALTKRGRVLPEPQAYENAKEASLCQVADGSWRLFFEYARDGRSLIGAAESASLEGPWAAYPDPIGPRPGRWDDHHLSPGPILGAGTDSPVLIYNGANAETHWRIGWAQLDPDCRYVVARCGEPLVTPPPAEGDATDIAFVASAVELMETTYLYYAVSDRSLFRAALSTS